MDVAIYCNGLSNRSPRFFILVYMASEKLFLQVGSNCISRSKEHKFNIWNDKQCLQSLETQEICYWKSLTWGCCRRHSTLHTKLNFCLAPNMKFPIEVFITASPACVCDLSPDISPPALFIVGEASFLHKLWPYWAASCMQRLLDIPWLTDHPTTAWMCRLACSEGTHHCQSWAGRSPMDGASRCVPGSYWFLWFSPPAEPWNVRFCYCTAVQGSMSCILCQKYISEVVMVFW